MKTHRSLQRTRIGLIAAIVIPLLFATLRVTHRVIKHRIENAEPRANIPEDYELGDFTRRAEEFVAAGRSPKEQNNAADVEQLELNEQIPSDVNGNQNE